jgi:hypothetical protein
MRDSQFGDQTIEERDAIRIPGPVKSLEQLKRELEALKSWKLAQVIARLTGSTDSQ